MSSHAAIPSESWEAHRAKIHSLYIDQDMPLDQVMSAMRADGLHASKQQYARQFKKWRVTKNQKASDWKYISQIVNHRTREGKVSVVFINDQEIPLAKIRKETRRYDLPSWTVQPYTPEILDHVRVCTPHSLRNALCADTSWSSSQLGRLERGQAIHGVRCLTSISIDNLPSLQFMDLLDLNVRKNEDTLISRSFTTRPDLLDDMKYVLKLCDFSLQFKGLSSQNLHLSLEAGGVQYNHWKRLDDLSSSIQCSSTKQALPGFVQLLKIVVTLSANGHLDITSDNTFRDLVDILQTIDPLRHFLQLVSVHNLYWILERVISMHTAATDIFASNILSHAVDLRLHKLVRILLQSKCPLDSRKYEDYPDFAAAQRRGDFFTALGLAAAFQRDLDLVRSLISAGADVYCSDHWVDEPVLQQVLTLWHGTPLSDSDMVLFQCLVDAQIVTYQPHYKKKWEQQVAKALFLNEINLCNIILENLLRLTEENTHETCSALIKSAMTNQVSFLATVLSYKQEWLDHLRQDWISRLILRSALGITILRPSGEVLQLLIDHGPSLSADFEFDIYWVLQNIPAPDHDMILLLCRCHHTYFNDCSKFWIMLKALKHEWFDVIRVLRNHGIGLHQHWPHKFRSGLCLMDMAVVQDHLPRGSELLDLILEDAVSMNEEELLYFLKALARTGEPSLLERFVEQYKIISSKSNAILETPEFLLFVFGFEGWRTCWQDFLKRPWKDPWKDPQNSKVLLWLIGSGIRFDALNEKLSNNIHHLSRDFEISGWPQFCHHPEVLQSALANGLRPCQALLIMCTIYFSIYRTENLRLILEAAMTLGASFSREELTDCLRIILKALTEESHMDSKYFSWQIVAHFDMLSKAYKSHSAALKLLVEFGAVVEIPWLQNLENFAGHYDKYLFITLRGGGGPLNGAITIEDNLLLEKLLKDGFFHDDYYSIKEEHSNMVQSWRTPLQFAVDSGNCKATNLLLKHGANINAPAYPDDGSTALQCAAQKGDLNMALDLLQLGAHINAPAAKSEGHTALECAALEGHLDLAQLLINNNSEIPNLRQDCKRASRIAKSKRHSVLATMLENHACKLAERLGVDHTDEIDNMCACDLNRISDPSCEKCHPLAQRSYYYPVHWEF